MKKRSFILAAALSAVMTISYTAAPCFYALDEMAAQTSEISENESVIEVTDKGKFSSYKSGRALAADSKGNVYYWGSDKNGSVFYRADENGKVVNSYRIDNCTDEDGNVIGVANAEIKPLDDYIIITYQKCISNFYFGGTKGNVVVKLDSEMNELETCELPKSDSFDTNGEKAVYVYRNKIHLADMDGKNKKVIYAAGGDDGIKSIDFVAASEKYIGFQGSDDSDKIHYSGVIDIETGEVKIEQQNRKGSGVKSFNNDLLVYETHCTKQYNGGDSIKYYSDTEYYIFDGEGFSTFNTEDKFEDLIIDCDGNYITSKIGGGKMVIRFYRNGKVYESFDVTDSDDGFVYPVINGGTVAVCTTVIPEGADGSWHKIHENDPVEYTEPFPINTHIFTYSKQN